MYLMLLRCLLIVILSVLTLGTIEPLLRMRQVYKFIFKNLRSRINNERNKNDQGAPSSLSQLGGMGECCMLPLGPGRETSPHTEFDAFWRGHFLIVVVVEFL